MLSFLINELVTFSGHLVNENVMRRVRKNYEDGESSEYESK